MNKNQLIDRIKSLTKQIYSSPPPTEPIYDELTKFPELKEVLVDLLTNDYNHFLSSIDWVAPRPTTFRINLKNDQEFYLIYTEKSWIAQVQGKKYYLKNLPEEERAAKSIANILRYGLKDEEPIDGEMDEFGASEESPEESTPPTEEPPTED